MCLIDLSDSRKEKFEKVASQRQLDLTIVLENVHDLHNIGAVLRTCDSVGIDEVFIIDTDPRLIGRKIYKNQSSSTGINKWVKINYYTDIDFCMKTVKLRYKNSIGTVLDTNAKSLYEMDFRGSIAIVLGNEKIGISEELQKHIDVNMIIPQVGFAQSLNVSVACAVILYEVFRQRFKNGMYEPKKANQIVSRFRKIHEEKKLNKIK